MPYNAHQVGVLREAAKAVTAFLVSEDISFEYTEPGDTIVIDPHSVNDLYCLQVQEILDHHKRVKCIGPNFYEIPGVDTDLYVTLGELDNGKAGLDIRFRDM